MALLLRQPLYKVGDQLTFTSVLANYHRGVVVEVIRVDLSGVVPAFEVRFPHGHVGVYPDFQLRPAHPVWTPDRRRAS
jgi:hypothetical protein